MTADNDIARRSVAAQSHMFRLAERDHGLTRKVLHLETGIPVSTLKAWANDTAMPVYGLAILAKVVPDYLTSLVVEAAGKCISTPEADDGLDELAIEASGFVADYVQARADGQLDHVERAKLNERKRRLKAVA